MSLVANRVVRVNVQKIKDLAKEKGMSIKQFEEYAGVGNGAIGKWESTDAKLDTIYRVAKALDTSVDNLMQII